MNTATTQSHRSPAEVVDRFQGLLEAQGLSVADAAQKIGCTSEALTDALEGREGGGTDWVLTAMLRELREPGAARFAGLPIFTLTSVAQRILGALKAAQTEGQLLVVGGVAGLGKTTAVRAYVEHQPAVTYLVAGPGSTPRAVLQDVALAVGASPAGTVRRLTQTIGRALSEGGQLLCVDDSDWLIQDTGQALRVAWDRARCGLAFVCTPAWARKLDGRDLGTLSQLRDRALHVQLSGCTGADIELLLQGEQIEKRARRRIVEIAMGSARRALLLAAEAKKLGAGRITKMHVDIASAMLLPAGA